jgi:hypothetical protein
MESLGLLLPIRLCAAKIWQHEKEGAEQGNAAQLASLFPFSPSFLSCSFLILRPCKATPSSCTPTKPDMRRAFLLAWPLLTPRPRYTSRRRSDLQKRWASRTPAHLHQQNTRPPPATGTKRRAHSARKTQGDKQATSRHNSAHSPARVSRVKPCPGVLQSYIGSVPPTNGGRIEHA